MAKQPSSIEKLYNSVNQEYDLGTIDQFKQDMSDPNKRAKLHGAIAKSYELPDFGTFSKDMGFVEKKSSNVPTASSGMGVLLAGKGKPQSGLEQLNQEVVKGVIQSSTNEQKELKKREEQAKMTDIQLDVLAPTTKVLPNFIRSGISQIASGLSYLPGALLDIATSNPVSTAGLAPGSAGSIESPKLTAEERPKEIDDAVKYFYKLGSDFKGQSQDLMLSSKVKAGIKNPNLDTVSQFAEGNMADGAKSLALDMGNTLTQMSAMAFGATPLIGASMVGSNLGEEVSQDNNISFTDLAQSIGKAGGELMLEKFFNKDLLGTQSIVNGLGNILTPAGNALKGEILKKGASVVKKELIRDMAGVGRKAFEGSKDEIIEETSAVGLSFLIDAIDQDKFNTKSFEKLGHDMASAVLVAGATGGAVSGLAANISMQRLSREEKASIERLESVANDESKSKNLREIALSVINDIRTGAGITANETIEKASKLPLDKKVEALALKEEINSINDDLDGANDLIREKLEPIKVELEAKLESLFLESNFGVDILKVESLKRDKLLAEEVMIDTSSTEEEKALAFDKTQEITKELIELEKKVKNNLPIETENDKAITQALSTPQETTMALEAAKKFQPKRIDELLAPKIGDSATLFDKNGEVVESGVQVSDIDIETNIVTITDSNGKDKKVPLARVNKTIGQVAQEFHSGVMAPELLTEIVTKDISDPDINQQRRMSAQVQSVGNKNIIGAAPEWVQKIYKKYVSSGDRGAVRALETKESILAEKRDRLASVSKRLSSLIGKDTESRKDANTVLSQDYVDDKIDSFTNKKTDEAISVLTGVELDKLREAYVNPNTDDNKELLKSVNDSLKSQTEKGTKKEVEELIYGEVTKDKESVRNLSVEWMNVGRGDNKSAVDRKIARQEIEDKLLVLPNGEKIVETLKEAKLNTIQAKRNLLKTKPGRELLTTVNEARDMIDEFSKWVENNVAALKIRDKDIGESIINNSGLYIKKTYDYWTDKDFTLDEKAGKQAINSIKTTLLPQRLSALAATKKFELATEEKRADMVQAVVEKAEKDASMIFAKYVAEISAKKEFKPSNIYPNETKVQSKNTWEREFINEEFGKILGRSEDAIDRLHASVVAQAQIQSAAEMGMILEQLSGEKFYDSQESAIDSLMKEGMTEIEAGEVIGKGFKEVNDKYSPLDGKLIPVDIYDTVYEQLNASHNALWDALKAATVLWRMTKTVFNPAGHITNAMGGHISIAEQGHLIDNKTVDFFLDRFRLTKGSNNISDYAKEIKKKMVDTGLWGTSVSIADINILLKYANDLGSGDKNISQQALIQVKKIFNERLGGVKRYYSATDDFSKLILFHKKKDIFAKKLYGKPYESLTTKEEAIVDANIAERVKQNMPTGSRLPKFAKAIIGSVVLGDFQGFRFGAFTSFANTLGNAYGDIEKGFKDKSLSPEQKKAYLLDGFKTLSSSMTVFSLDKSMAAVMTGMTASILGTMAKGLFDDKEDENGNPIGSRFDFYQNVKNSFYMPEWGFGQNLIVSSDNGKGKLKLLNLSNTFPNDESYKLFGSQENLPALSWDNRSALGSAIVETFGTNAVLNIFTNAIEGKDNWNRPIDNSILGRLAYAGGEFAIPSLKHINKEAIAFAKDKQGEAPVDRDEIDTRRVTLLNYLHGMLVNSPQLIKRTYTLDIPQQVYFNLGAFYKDNAKKFESLTDSEKYERIKKLEPVRKAFVQLRKYETFTNGNVNAEEVFSNAFTGLRGKASDEEKAYILTGEKPFEK